MSESKQVSLSQWAGTHCGTLWIQHVTTFTIHVCTCASSQGMLHFQSSVNKCDLLEDKNARMSESDYINGVFTFHLSHIRGVEALECCERRINGIWSQHRPMEGRMMRAQTVLLSAHHNNRQLHGSLTPRLAFQHLKYNESSDFC